MHTGIHAKKSVDAVTLSSHPVIKFKQLLTTGFYRPVNGAVTDNWILPSCQRSRVSSVLNYTQVTSTSSVMKSEGEKETNRNRVMGRDRQTEI